jgi:acetolactate synthase-1/2/3 large subunit
MPIFAALTKFNARVDSVERLPDLLATAFRAATTGMPRPVHLQLDGFYGVSMGNPLAAVPAIDTRYGHFPSIRPLAPETDIARAIKALNAANRPVIVAGGGVQSSQAGSSLRAFARRMQIPVATSLSAKSVITHADPLCIGCVGEYSQAPANRAVAESDLVFFIGTPTGGLTTLNWTLPPPNTPVIHLDIDAETIGRNYRDCLPLLGDAHAVLDQMLDHATAPSWRAHWLRTCASYRDNWHRAVEERESQDAAVLRPERLCRLISDLMPANAILVGDTGHASAWLAQNIAVRSTDQHIIRADGSLGWSLPAAIGAKCAAPDREVISFGGDASFLYHIAELETAVRYGRKIIAIINNNVSMNQERMFWGDDRSFESNWRFKDTDFSHVAEGLGCLGLRADSSQTFEIAFRRALKADRPTVIDVRTGEDAFPMPAWRPDGVPDEHAPESA